MEQPPGTDRGLRAAVRCYKGLSCLCIVAAHHGPAREQRHGEKAELGSIMKTMYLTSPAGDEA